MQADIISWSIGFKLFDEHPRDMKADSIVFLFNLLYLID